MLHADMHSKPGAATSDLPFCHFLMTCESMGAMRAWPAQDIVVPIKRPADMVEYLRTMPSEEIAERQAALRVARSKFFYMQLPHSRGTTSSQARRPAARRFRF